MLYFLIFLDHMCRGVTRLVKKKSKNRAQNTQNRTLSGINNNLNQGAEIARAPLLVPWWGSGGSRVPAHTVTPGAVLLLWAPTSHSRSQTHHDTHGCGWNLWNHGLVWVGRDH